MRGYSSEDDFDTNIERHIAFLEVANQIDEDILIPKIFNQFEKDYLKNPSKEFLRERYELSDYWLNKLWRVCQRRKRIGASQC